MLNEIKVGFWLAVEPSDTIALVTWRRWARNLMHTWPPMIQENMLAALQAHLRKKCVNF